MICAHRSITRSLERLGAEGSSIQPEALNIEADQPAGLSIMVLGQAKRHSRSNNQRALPFN